MPHHPLLDEEDPAIRDGHQSLASVVLATGEIDDLLSVGEELGQLLQLAADEELVAELRLRKFI